MTLVHQSRRVLAERLSWPARALDACECLQREHPGWEVWWRHENSSVKGFEHKAGLYAWREGDQPQRNGVRRRELYGATADQLECKLP